MLHVVAVDTSTALYAKRFIYSYSTVQGKKRNNLANEFEIASVPVRFSNMYMQYKYCTVGRYEYNIKAYG